MDEDRAAQYVLFTIIEAYPKSNITQLTYQMRTFLAPGFSTVSESWVQRAIQNWGWTWRKTQKVSLNKFTDVNKADWIAFGIKITTLEWGRVR
jgi:hypothetical protein